MRAALWVAADAAVVLMVSVAITAAGPVIAGGTVNRACRCIGCPRGAARTCELACVIRCPLVLGGCLLCISNQPMKSRSGVRRLAPRVEAPGYRADGMIGSPEI